MSIYDKYHIRSIENQHNQSTKTFPCTDNVTMGIVGDELVFNFDFSESKHLVLLDGDAIEINSGNPTNSFTLSKLDKTFIYHVIVVSILHDTLLLNRFNVLPNDTILRDSVGFSSKGSNSIEYVMDNGKKLRGFSSYSLIDADVQNSTLTSLDGEYSDSIHNTTIDGGNASTEHSTVYDGGNAQG